MNSEILSFAEQISTKGTLAESGSENDIQTVENNLGGSLIMSSLSGYLGFWSIFDEHILINW